jgi:hypothetical protein
VKTARMLLLWALELEKANRKLRRRVRALERAQLRRGTKIPSSDGAGEGTENQQVRAVR